MTLRDLVPWNWSRHSVPVRRDEAAQDPIRSLHSQVNRLFEDFWRDFGVGMSPWSGEDRFVPSVDISESDDELLVKAELPGMAPENLDISLSDNLLTIRGEKKHEDEGERDGYRYRESRSGSFLRQIPLPMAVDGEHVKAEVRNGVLSIRLPKAEESKARHIEVRAA